MILEGVFFVGRFGLYAGDGEHHASYNSCSGKHGVFGSACEGFLSGALTGHLGPHHDPGVQRDNGRWGRGLGYTSVMGISPEWVGWNPHVS
jgi:hypothetical protein